MIVSAADAAVSSTAETSDGLARPVDYGARHGAGNDRALVLGGGGIFFIAWQAGYLNGLRRRGVDVANAEIVVGTSAGAVVAGILTARRLASFSRQVGMLADGVIVGSALIDAVRRSEQPVAAAAAFTAALRKGLEHAG
jgi:hypothetical protein